MLASLAAMVVAGPSVVMPAPVAGVATEGQWTSIAQGAGAHDCDRVSIWSIKVYRLGRKTSCTIAGHRIAALSEIDNRAVWLHVTGEGTRTWTLWTATTTSPSPRLLARVTGPAGSSAPIVLGPGNMDRGQLTYGEGDVLPYAIGRNVTVLNAGGQRGRHVTSINVDPQECKLDLTLGVGEHLAGAGGGRVAILAGPSFRVIPGCGGHPVASGAATAFALDSNHFVSAQGRRVTRHQLPSP